MVKHSRGVRRVCGVCVSFRPPKLVPGSIAGRRWQDVVLDCSGTHCLASISRRPDAVTLYVPVADSILPLCFQSDKKDESRAHGKRLLRVYTAADILNFLLIL